METFRLLHASDLHVHRHERVVGFPDNLALLVAAIAQTRPGGLLCGHTHLVSRQDVFASVPVFVCGSTTQWYAPHGNYLQVITVEVDPSGRAAPLVGFQSFPFGPNGFFP
jgi:hypothetical protein